MCFQIPNILRLLKSSELSLKGLKFRKYKEESFNHYKNSYKVKYLDKKSMLIRV